MFKQKGQIRHFLLYKFGYEVKTKMQIKGA